MSGIGIAVQGNNRGGEPITGLRDTIERMAEIGFSHVELGAKTLFVSIAGQVHPKRLEILRGELDGAPVRFTLHGTGVSSERAGNLVDVTSTAQRRVTEADVALAGAIGAEVLVHHSGMLRDVYGDDDALAAGLRAERDALRALGDEAGQLGVRVAVENIDPVGRYVARRGYGLRLDRLANQVVAIDHPQIGICLDVGHAYLASRYVGFDYLAAIREIAPLVTHLHISDNLGRTQLDADADSTENLALGDGDLHLPPGWGDVPLAEIFAIPFPRDPIAILEIRGTYATHYPEAFATVHGLRTERLAVASA